MAQRPEYCERVRCPYFEMGCSLQDKIDNTLPIVKRIDEVGRLNGISKVDREQVKLECAKSWLNIKE